MEQIAVVGLSCRVPGAAGAEEFWANLAAGRVDIAEVGPQHWDRERFHRNDSGGSSRMVTDQVGALSDAYAFDHALFGMTPRQAELTDPQYRLLLQESWRCIEDSGLPLRLLREARTSVNVGLMAQDHLIRALMNDRPVDAYDPLGAFAGMAANQVSFRLGLTGPSRTVDTACSASLVALAQGRGDLLWEGCDFALVGGVSLVGAPWRHLAFGQARMLSPDGRSFTFDARANGYVPGEGAGVVLLTALSNARQLGCHVYGVLRGIASNHNGHNRSLTAPSVTAQVDVLSRALADAAIPAREVDYVEAHGTGTSLGDPIEIEALASVYGDDRSAPLAVGSVKPNIGHLEAAAGIIGFIKVLLMLRHRCIVPTVGHRTVNPLIRAPREQIMFPDSAVEWARGPGSRVGAVSSFGFGGVNCHAIVAEYDSAGAEFAAEPVTEPEPAVFTLAARTPEALAAAVHAWSRVPLPADDTELAALCRTTNQRALDLPFRFGAMAAALAEALNPVGPQSVPAADDLASGGHPEAEVSRTDHLTGLIGGMAHDCGGAPAEQVWARVRDGLADIVAEPEVTAPVAAFARALAWLRRLEAAGVRFAELIGADGPGTAAALVHTGAIGMPDALAALLDGSGVQLTDRPSSTVMTAAGFRCEARELTARYLTELVEDGVRTPEQLRPYLDTARTLLDRQHTFTRALGRWETALGAYGLSVRTLISEDGEPSAPAVAGLVIDAALTDIDHAWDLTPASWVNEHTHELGELVRHDILSPADALDLLHDRADADALAAGARRRLPAAGAVSLAVLDRVGAYSALPRIPLHSAAAIALPVDRPVSVVLSSAPLPASAGALMAGSGPDAFERLLLALWLHGHAVDWSGPQHNSFRRRPGLPSYVFDAQVHRLPDTSPRLDSSSPELTGTGAHGGTRTPADPDPVIELLRELVAEAVGVPLTQVRETSVFADLGLESVTVHRLNEELAQRFGDVAVTLFFECADIRGVAERLHRDYGDRVAAYVGDPAPPPRPLRLLPDPAPIPLAPWVNPPAVRAAPEPWPHRPGPARDGAGSGRRGPAPLDIAVIGLDIRAPGAETVDAFWENLCAGTDSVTEVPPSRWNHDDYFAPGPGVPGKVYARWGGFLPDTEYFDAAEFGISPAEARFMDPHERLFLDSTRRCLEVAGYTRRRLAEEIDGDVGVFAGATYSNYQLLQYEANRVAPINSQTYAIANRVSYVNGLQGPSLVVDTACSSSLYAVHLACAALARSECAMAVAGGVNLSLHPSKYQMLAHYRFLSTDGRCRAYGEGGDGYVPAEAVGTFLLKPLEQAEWDGDDIYGVIRGSAVTHGGRTNGFTVPSPAAQANAISRALAQAGVAPQSIGYIEGHGAGTRLGDPIEVAGITAALGSGHGQFCALGSVKSNIGHAEAAAGVAQLAKVLLQLRNRTLVPSLHAEPVNAAIDFAGSPVFVQQRLAAWEPGAAPRRAGVTSLGAGGTNVHLVVEEYL